MQKTMRIAHPHLPKVLTTSSRVLAICIVFFSLFFANTSRGVAAHFAACSVEKSACALHLRASVGDTPRDYCSTQAQNEADSLHIKRKPKGVKVKGTAYRYEDKAKLLITWQPHPLNVASNHRYSKPGVGAVYAATSPETALKEVMHYGVDMNMRVLVTRTYKLRNALDLTNPKTREMLGVTLEEITGDSYDLTHKLGDFARQNGYDGMVVPSARNAGGVNIVVFKGL